MRLLVSAAGLLGLGSLIACIALLALALVLCGRGLLILKLRRNRRSRVLCQRDRVDVLGHLVKVARHVQPI